jgi:hypothetical protein
VLVPFETHGAKSIKRARKGNVPTAFSVEVNSVRLGNDNREEGVFFTYGLLLGHSKASFDGYSRLDLVELDSEDWLERTVEKNKNHLKILGREGDDRVLEH